MTTKITITEALAELKIIKSKVEKKSAFITNYLARQEAIKDPLDKQGGSVGTIKSERQAISDLLERFVKIRSKISEANSGVGLTIGSDTRSVADWIVWKRDIAPVMEEMFTSMTRTVSNMRMDSQRKGLKVLGPGENATAPTDVVVNIDEKELADNIEKLAETLGVLDGKLSLHNATVMVEV